MSARGVEIIELFDDLRKRIDGGKSHKESEMHNLIFPMIKDDREVEYEEHNLWLLDERFNFTQYIASDKSKFLVLITRSQTLLYFMKVGCFIEMVIMRLHLLLLLLNSSDLNAATIQMRRIQ